MESVKFLNGVSVGDKVVALGDVESDIYSIENGTIGTIIELDDNDGEDYPYHIKFFDNDSVWLERSEFKITERKIKTHFHGKPVDFLGGNDWAHIYQFNDNGYTFLHEPKWNDVGIGILPWRRRGGQPEFLAVMENRPTHGDEHRLYAITGGYDNTELTAGQTAIKELKEETGYIASEKDVIYLGEIYTTKMSTSKMHLFAVEVTNLQQVEKTTDGSVIEHTAYPVWVDYKKLVLEGDNLLSKMYNLTDVYLAEKGYHFV